MSPQEALNILDQLSQKVPMIREDHNKVIMALQTLKLTIDDRQRLLNERKSGAKTDNEEAKQA